ncbi:type 2 DNA topoisomerase 6 subunit B-like isoform X2 [Malania oleifera]|uniref:type 2 DNA topoisomerase 6 subunit B-like isoform X2 n=1 Tax=Malania oleifera TaxID=397392 RepID=UPI0025AE8FCE|nr:type 2 DNA topoisomerase 6 subunit B-like isoform X2 [Malania oleifera]
MEVSSVPKLCQRLISSAIQRCRISDDFCRLSVVLKRSPLVRISISDTGVGSCLEDFQDWKFTMDSVSAEKWDGVISVTTTSISDNEIFQYCLNLKESTSARRLIKLPSNPKNGAKFSGTEVSLSSFENIDDLLVEIAHFLRKMQVLKIPVAIELVVEHCDSPISRSEKFILANECIPQSFLSSNLERLRSGFEDYVYKHGNSLDKRCHSCFPTWEHLKVGSGMAHRAGSRSSSDLVTEAVIVISESSEPSCACFRAYGAKTEVLYFKDFLLCSIPQSSLNALASIDWKSYGLTLRTVVEQDGHAILEWESLPSCAHIDIVLHFYQKQVILPLAGQKTQVDRNLIKNAVKLALGDLKEKHPGALLSTRALKIRSYAPDLARTIAALILSSNNSNFQEECFSLLGLPSQEIRGEIVECCITGKIVSVVETNDRKPSKSAEAAPFLFEDCFHEPDIQEGEYEDEETYSTLDL